MAAVSATSVRFLSFPRPAYWGNQNGQSSKMKMVSIRGFNRNYRSLRPARPHICYAAKPETVTKVCEIVKKQLALSDDITLTPESKFSALGADSLDTVEIVMGLEEEFGITVEEDGSQNITTVLEAAELIDKLVEQTITVKEDGSQNITTVLEAAELIDKSVEQNKAA